jgi:GT2 family glycosyltransferase
MARGVLVVTSAYIGSGLEGSLRHGENCLLYPFGNVAAAVECIVKSQDVELRSRLTSAGIAFVREKMTRERSIKYWSQCFADINSQPIQAPSLEDGQCEPAGRLDRLLCTQLAELARHFLNRNPVPVEYPKRNSGTSQEPRMLKTQKRFNLAIIPPVLSTCVSGKMLPSVSVCICTQNRSESLRRALASVASQIGIDLGPLEVLVVDNNSTDGTPKVVEAFRQRLPIRRVVENRQGLAHARNAAIAEFRGDVLLFTDDDVWLGRGWLAGYRDVVCRFPDVDYFGGRILPDWGRAKPRWIGDEPLPLIDGALVWFDHGIDTRLFRTTEATPFGASFAIRRRLFEKIGLFRVDLGTGGIGPGRGEETEFLMRARDANAQGVYVGEAVCFHAYDPERFTLAALYRYGVSCGRSHNAIVARPHRGSFPAAAWFVLRGLCQAVKGRGDQFRQCVINAGIEVGSRAGYR